MRCSLLIALLLTPDVARYAHADVVFSQGFGGTLSGMETINGFGAGQFQLSGGTLNQGPGPVNFGSNMYTYYEVSGIDLTRFNSASLTFGFTAQDLAPTDVGFNVLASLTPLDPFNNNSKPTPGVAVSLLEPDGLSEIQYIDGPPQHRLEIGVRNYGGDAPDSSLASFDLTQFAGHSGLNIRLQFGTNNGITPGIGMVIDDLLIEGTAVPEPSSYAALSLAAIAFFGCRRRFQARS